MRFGKLFFKIILAFIAVLVAAELVVYGLIHSGKIHPPYFKNAIERMSMVELLIKRDMHGLPVTDDNIETRVTPLLHLLVRGFNGYLWLTNDSGHIVSSSFNGAAPPLNGQLVEISIDKPDNISFYGVEREDTKSIYLTAAMSLNNNKRFTAHLLYGKHPRRSEQWFFHGLLLLTFFGAIFIFPVSRMITKPIHSLSETAERIGRGDFSKRVPEKGHDEVADLARRFNRMADRLERMVIGGKELTAHLSHELRSPLARLRISLQILMEQAPMHNSPAASGNAALYEGMQDEIEHMDKLIGKILALSKLDMHELPPMKDQIDLVERIEMFLAKYRPMIKHRKIALQTDFSPVPPIRCYAQAMDMLFENIFDNAFKFTENEGNVTVRTAEQRGMAVVTICNTHPALTEEQLKTMFMPFHRLDMEEADGTGIGLAAAKKIVDLHQGSIVASNKDGGVCITITFGDNELA